MENTSSIGKSVQPFSDIPPRTFDLLPRFVEKYGKKKTMFACKVMGIGRNTSAAIS